MNREIYQWENIYPYSYLTSAEIMLSQITSQSPIQLRACGAHITKIRGATNMVYQPSWLWIVANVKHYSIYNSIKVGTTARSATLEAFRRNSIMIIVGLHSDNISCTCVIAGHTPTFHAGLQNLSPDYNFRKVHHLRLKVIWLFYTSKIVFSKIWKNVIRTIPYLYLNIKNINTSKL